MLNFLLKYFFIVYIKFKLFIKIYFFEILLMLGFSYHSKGTGNKWINNEPNFDTIMITNKLPK